MNGEFLIPGILFLKIFTVIFFEFKVKSSLGTRSEKGTGLGLPLCKKIADQLELGLGFEVDSDAGNVFFFKEILVSINHRSLPVLFSKTLFCGKLLKFCV